MEVRGAAPASGRFAQELQDATGLSRGVSRLLLNKPK
jgi:hypothetical protein